MATYINREAQKQIVNYDSFDVSNVNYKPPKVNSRGGKNIAITYEGKPLRLQIPLTFTWGAQEHEDETTGNKSYSMNLNLDKGSVLFEKLKAFEDKVIADAIANSKKWFGKAKMTEDVVDALFYKILKFPKDKETDELDMTRNPNMKVKLSYWEGKFNLALFNMNKEVIYSSAQGVTDSHPTELIPLGSLVSAIIECGGVWFAAGRFGVTWRLVQGKVKQPIRMDGYCMLDDPEEDAMLERINAKEKEQLSKQQSEEETSEHAEELPDTEDEAEQETAPEPEPPKPVKKKTKVVRKKKKADE
jgi:hypothetical protein